MSKGLLAEWRREVVGRGLTAAACCLAVPVAVAAAIGFEGSLAGLGEGLDCPRERARARPRPDAGGP